MNGILSYLQGRAARRLRDATRRKLGRVRRYSSGSGSLMTAGSLSSSSSSCLSLCLSSSSSSSSCLSLCLSSTLPIENVPTWLVDWSLVTIIDNTLPPRDPNDDDNEDDEDDERHNERHDEDDEPAVIREPDPDE